MFCYQANIRRKNNMDITNSFPAFLAPDSSKFQNRFNTRNYYNANSIQETAFGRWPEILEFLGVDPKYLTNKAGPCPICRAGKDRFRFDDKGRGSYYCNTCGAGYGFKLLQLFHGWSYPATLEHVAKFLRCHSNETTHSPKRVSYYIKKNNEPTQLIKEEICKRQKYLNLIWQAAKPIVIGDPVDCYLKSRGINLDIFVIAALRFHSRLPYYSDDTTLVGHFPAMLALVKDEHDRGVTLHRTYLGEGCKAEVPKPKKLMSPIVPGGTQGAAIKLYEPANGKLALAEGIETALAFSIATQLPAWATISASGMEKVILPPTATDITIAVDHDKSGRGQKAAFILSQRLLNEGRNVKRIIPPKIDTDFADLLLEENR
jgi:putative DNA primase/helicase